jgi:replicative superfamily II helicase
VNVFSKTQRFEFKINIENEKQRQMFRERMAEKNQMINENMHVIEAIEEGKRVSAYFETEDQARRFVVALAEAKEIEQKGYNLEEIDKHSKLSRATDHKVIPSREELSRRLVTGGIPDKLIEGGLSGAKLALIDSTTQQHQPKLLPGEEELLKTQLAMKKDLA